MHFRTVVSIILAAGLLTGTGMAAAQQMKEASNSSTSSGTMSDSQLSDEDREFLERAAESGHTELEGSRLAETRSTNPDVQAFASQMIQEHTKLHEDLSALAQGKGYAPPPEPSIVQKAKLETIGVLEGELFDKAYVSQIAVGTHEEAVELYRQHSQPGSDPDVRAFAADVLPTLEEHLKNARTLQQKVDEHR